MYGKRLLVVSPGMFANQMDCTRDSAGRTCWTFHLEWCVCIDMYINPPTKRTDYLWIFLYHFTSKFTQRLTVEYFWYAPVRWSYGIVLYEIVTLGKPSYVQSIHLTLRTAMRKRYRSNAIFVTIILIRFVITYFLAIYPCKIL